MHEYLKFFGTNNQQEIDRFLIYERDLLLSTSYWKLSDLYNLKLFRELSIDFYFRVKKIIDLIKRKKLPIEKFENIDELTIDDVKELLGEDHRTYLKTDHENFIISAFVESLQRCFNYFDFNSNFDLVIEKKILKIIFSENEIIIDGFNHDLDEQVKDINIWDKGYLLRLEQENSLVASVQTNTVEFSDVIYLEDSFSEQNQTQNEYPLYYKNYTFKVQEVACLLSGYNPISIGSQWEYVHWLKENPKFEEALDFVWSAVRGDIFDAISGNDFVIESEKLKIFLAERKFFIDGFNKHLEPLGKDRMPESNNLILGRLEQKNQDLKIQLLERDEIIKELKKNQAHQDMHPSLNPNNPSHAPELLVAIEVWEEKYQKNQYPHLEHTPAITNILKNRGITRINLVKRICAITNIKSNKSIN